MATATINWVSGGGGGTQTLQMRRSDGQWANAVTNIPAGVTTASVPNIDPNWIYEFRVVNNCGGTGTATTSAPFNTMMLTCPVLSISTTSDTISYSFPHLGGDVRRYVVTRYAADGATPLDSKTHTSPSGTIAGTFTGVAVGSYNIGVRVDGGDDFRFTKTCPNQLAEITATPCPAPTGVSATIS